MRLLVFALVFVTVGGCIDGYEPSGEPVSTAALGVAEYQDIVQPRVTAANVTIREARTQGAAPDPDGSDGWRDRNTVLAYHGLAEVHDEWAQLVPAHIFRLSVQQWVTKSFSVNLDGSVEIDGEYEVVNFEYAFDAADGRFLGTTNLDAGVRSFAAPGQRLPWAWGPGSGLFLSMVEYMHGDLTARVTYTSGPYTITSWLEPYDGKRPLAGDCSMYIRRGEVEGPGVEPQTPVEPDPDPYRSLVCFDTAMVPRWVWYGNEMDGGVSYTREGPGFSWQGPLGDIVGPAPFVTRAMEPIDPLLPIGDPIFVPPADADDVWANAVRDRVAGVRGGVPHIRFDATEGPSYADHVVTGWPPHTIAPLLGPPEAMSQFTETTWVMLKAEQTLFTFVHTLGLAEGTTYIADVNGFQSDGTLGIDRWELEEIGEVVLAGDVHRRARDLSPEGHDHITWFVWPKFVSAEAPMIWWVVANECFQPPEDPRFIMFDGKDGHLLVAGRHATSDNGCAMGGFRAFLDGQEVVVHPATSDRQFPVILAGDGTHLARPLPPDALGRSFTLA